MWQYLGVLHARMKDEFPEKTTLKIGTAFSRYHPGE